MRYARATQQTSDAEPALAQRWFTVYDAGPTPHQNRFNVSCPPGTTNENMRADPPGKTQTTTQSGFTAGPPFRTPAQQQNNIGPMPASHGQCRHQQAKTLSQSRPKSWTIVYDDDPTTRRHRPRASPAKHENVQPMSVQCCPIVLDAGPTLQQHRPHASRPPGYAYTGPTNAATRWRWSEELSTTILKQKRDNASLWIRHTKEKCWHI